MALAISIKYYEYPNYVSNRILLFKIAENQ